MNNKLTIFLLTTMNVMLMQQQLMPLPSLFSKIVITSDRIEGAPLETQKKDYSIEYKGNVVVTLADKSTITSDVLKVIVEPTKKEKELHKREENHKMMVPSAIKTILFNGNVCITSQQDCIKANKAEIKTSTNSCLLYGNVQITHNKKKEKDVPATLTSSQASFNFETKELVLSGQAHKPVTTVLHLDKQFTMRRKPVKKATHTNGKNKNIT